MDFSGGSPETTKTSVSPQPTPEDSPSPAPNASPSPKSRGAKPVPAERTGVVWEEPPPVIPAAAAKPAPSAAPLPKRKPVVKHQQKISTRVALVSQSGNTEKEKAVPLPSPSAAPVPDPAKVRTELKERGQAKEEELRLEKEQIENGIKNSAGSVREQWKYRLAVLQEKMKTAKQDEAALK
jgi:hypothetical protein